MRNNRSRKWALALAIVFGTITILGIGHFYLGMRRRGAAFLLLGLGSLYGLAIGSSILLVPIAVIRPHQEHDPSLGLPVAAALVGLLAYGAFFLWQCLDLWRMPPPGLSGLTTLTSTQARGARLPRPRTLWLAVGLAAGGGLFTLLGLGHGYLGMWSRGMRFLVPGVALIYLAWPSLAVAAVVIGFVNPQFDPDLFRSIALGWTVAVWAAYVALLVWSCVDVRRLWLHLPRPGDTSTPMEVTL